MGYSPQWPFWSSCSGGWMEKDRYVVCRWEWGGKAEEVGRVVEQDWGIDGGVGNVCLVS